MFFDPAVQKVHDDDGSQSFVSKFSKPTERKKNTIHTFKDTRKVSFENFTLAT